MYKAKTDANEEVEKYNARLVAKWYKQKHGVGYEEVFVPVAFTNTIRLLISIATKNKWKLYQLNVKSTFLNDYFEEEVSQWGYAIKGHEYKVIRLRRTLCGLKQ